MTDEQTVIDIDLLPQTLRQWWLHSPRGYRSFLKGACVLIVISAALAARISIGLQEAPGITALRERGVVWYRWEQGKERFQGQHLLMAGLWGKSTGNVVGVKLVGSARDDDLAWIGAHLKHLEHLIVPRSGITSTGFHAVQPCRRLQRIDLTETEINDDGAVLLAKFPKLRSVNLSGTCVTDAVIPALEQLRQLEYVNLTYTDVTAEAVAAWRLQPYRGEQLDIFSNPPGEDNNYFLPVFHWSDGSTSARVIGPAELVIEPSLDGRKPRLVVRHLGNEQRWLFAEVLKELFGILPAQNGEHRVTLQIGEYSSEPVSVPVVQGGTTLRRFDFVMPVTRQQAEQSAASQ